MRTHHRHVAGVIVRAVVLLVSLVVLFIDDDEAEIGIGQEQRRARADHDRRLAGRDRRPIARAGARRQFGVPFQRTHAKTLREAIEKLAGQRDLRHQDQRLLAAANRFGNRLEIDFSLARAGDTVEQSDMKSAVGGERTHGVDRRALLGRKFRLGVVRIRRGRRRGRRHRFDRERAFVDQAVDHAAADARFLRCVGLAVQQAVRQHLDQPPPRRRQPPRRFANEAHAHAHSLRPQIVTHPQAHAQHHAAGGKRVIGDPVDEVAQFLLERRDVEFLARHP